MLCNFALLYENRLQAETHFLPVGTQPLTALPRISHFCADIMPNTLAHMLSNAFQALEILMCLLSTFLFLLLVGISSFPSDTISRPYLNN